MPPQLRIVLVEPKEGGNVGAVARAMKNFGFRDLVIVGAVPLLEPVAAWWASGAADVLEQMRAVADLQEALTGAHLTVATSSSRGRDLLDPVAPRDVSRLYGELDDTQTLALVFGREDRGLTSAETALCQRTAVIPTDSRFPTMNLAQAVAVFCYELASSSRQELSRTRDLADARSVERLHQMFRALLLESGFLQEQNPDHIYDELRSLAGRLALDEREVTLLMGLLRQMSWRLDQ